MHKILVIENNLQDYQDAYLQIHNQTITFLQNGDYLIEYQNCTNLTLNITLNPNVYIKLLEYSDQNHLETHNTYNIKGHSMLNLAKFYHNPTTNEHLIFNLTEEYAEVTYQFRTIATSKETYNFQINHLASHTTSDISSKALTIDDGSIIFNIDSYLPKGNPQSILNQETRIINLNNHHCQINPNMYIEEDDVEARHGSVIGNFSYDNIFYLMTRGINYNDSLKLLIKGFIFSNIPLDINTRGKIFNIINNHWR